MPFLRFLLYLAMDGLFKVLLIPFLAFFLGVSIIFQQGGLVIHIYDSLADSTYKTEQFSDILFDGLNDGDTSPDDQLPKNSSGPEEETTEKDESKFYEPFDLSSQLPFSLSVKPKALQNSFLSSLWLKIATPPPEDPTV